MRKFNKSMRIFEVMDRCPASTAIFFKYFGANTIIHPDLKMESINDSAKIFGINPDKIIKDINLLIQ